MIAIRITPDVLECGHATETVIEFANPSPTAGVYGIVVDIEPDHGLRLDGGDSHIEIDALMPGQSYAHPVTLTGRTLGASAVTLPYITYMTDDGQAHWPTPAPLMVHITARAVARTTAAAPRTDRPRPARLPSAFISHRRADSGWLGELLRNRLAELLSGSQFFLDYDNLAPGEAWRKRVDRELANATALLAVIGPKWQTCTNPAGQRRIDRPDDVVRHEIATALRRQILVIPVLHDGATLPAPDELPPDLRGLTEFQAISVDHGKQRDALRPIITELHRAGLR